MVSWKVLASLKCKVHLVPRYLVRWPQAKLSKLELAGQRQNFANLFHVRLLHLLYLLHTLCILHLLRLETATTNNLLSVISMLYKRYSVMLRSDQIWKERLFKIVECKDFALPTSRAGTHLQSMASATFLDCPSPLLFPHVLHPLQNLEKLLNIEQRNLSVLETFTTANKDTEALNPLLLWS